MRTRAFVVAVATMSSAAGCGFVAGSRTAPVRSAAPTTIPEAAPPSNGTTMPLGAGVQPEGFELVGVTITSADAEATSLTLWLATTPAQRSRGLMDVTDLGKADGMLFVFDEQSEHRFYMWRTPTPLDIFFFDESGDFVGHAEMEPCLDTAPSECERYSPGVPFLTAVETFDGALDDVDFDAETRLTLERVPPSRVTSTGPEPT